MENAFDFLIKHALIIGTVVGLLILFFWGRNHGLRRIAGALFIALAVLALALGEKLLVLTGGKMPLVDLIGEYPVGNVLTTALLLFGAAVLLYKKPLRSITNWWSRSKLPGSVNPTTYNNAGTIGGLMFIVVIGAILLAGTGIPIGHDLWRTGEEGSAVAVEQAKSFIGEAGVMGSSQTGPQGKSWLAISRTGDESRAQSSTNRRGGNQDYNPADYLPAVQHQQPPGEYPDAPKKEGKRRPVRYTSPEKQSGLRGPNP